MAASAVMSAVTRNTSSMASTNAVFIAIAWRKGKGKVEMIHDYLEREKGWNDKHRIAERKESLS